MMRLTYYLFLSLAAGLALTLVQTTAEAESSPVPSPTSESVDTSGLVMRARPAQRTTLDPYGIGEFECAVYFTGSVPALRPRFESTPASPKVSLPFAWDPKLLEPYKYKYKYDHSRRPPGPVYALDHGFLVGLNNGEWGGGVYWVNKNGTQASPVVGFINPRHIVAVAGRLLLLEGINRHLEGGAIYTLRDSSAGWRAHDYVDLRMTPRLVRRQSEDSILVAGDDGLARIGLSSRLRRYTSAQIGPTFSTHKGALLLQVIRPKGTLPAIQEMLVTDDGVIWLQTHWALIRLTPGGRPKDYAEDWFVPEDCPSLRVLSRAATDIYQPRCKCIKPP